MNIHFSFIYRLEQGESGDSKPQLEADDVRKNEENFLGLKSFEGVKEMGFRSV